MEVSGVWGKTPDTRGWRWRKEYKQYEIESNLSVIVPVQESHDMGAGTGLIGLEDAV